jgi:hypothetical protein
VTPPITGLSLPPGPITKGTLLDLPPAVKWHDALGTLESVLERDFLRAIARMLKPASSPRRTRVLASVDHDMDVLVRAIRRWLSVDFGTPTVRLFRPIWIELDPRLRGAQDKRRTAAARSIVEGVRILAGLEDLFGEGPNLGELTRGTMFAGWAATIDRFEDRLTPRVPELAFMSERLAEDAAQDLVGWLQLVRVGAAVAAVRAIAFRRVWGPLDGLPKKAEFRGGLYGTLGYELAERVMELSAAVAEHPLFEWLRDREADYPWMARYVTFSDTARGAQYAMRRQIEAVATSSTAWRFHCEREGCTQQEKGLVWPFEFTPLTEEEHGDHSLAGTTPDHMYARPPATTRVLQVRESWRFVHGLMKLPDDVLPFKINAGSLRRGGAHPPHRTHRNGAMFDLDLTVPAKESLDPVCTLWIGASEPVIRSDRERLEEEEARAQTEEERTRLVVEGLFPLMEPVPHEDPKTVTMSCVTDFLYAPERRVAGKKPEVVVRRFTQCMLLSLPSEVLFASWAVLRDSWNGLFARVRVPPAADDPPLDDAGKAALAMLQGFFDQPAPAAKPGRNSFRVLFPRDDHDNHWHVSYNPDDIEDDTFDRAKTLAWIAKNLARFFPEDTIDE